MYFKSELQIHDAYYFTNYFRKRIYQINHYNSVAFCLRFDTFDINLLSHTYFATFVGMCTKQISLDHPYQLRITLFSIIRSYVRVCHIPGVQSGWRSLHKESRHAHTHSQIRNTGRWWRRCRHNDFFTDARMLSRASGSRMYTGNQRSLG